MRPRPCVMVVLLALALGAAGCSEDDDGTDGRPGIVATTTQVADLARNVAGDRAEVEQILSPESDPHDYEPRPSDARALAEAELVLRSGGDLDDWLQDLLDNAAGDARTVTLIDAVRTRAGGHGHRDEEARGEDGEDAHSGSGSATGGRGGDAAAGTGGTAYAGDGGDARAEGGTARGADGGDARAEGGAGGDASAGEDGGEEDPHWWHDPQNAIAAVERIRDALIAVDPAGRAAYERNATRYAGRIRAVDARIARCFAAVPARNRKLVTNHDALGYFVDHYGIELVGTVIPALSTQAQASAGEVAELVRTIRREDVRAIFPESSLDTDLEEAIAREAGAKVGEPLYADTLGAPGSAGGTYLGALRANASAMVAGFTGGRRHC